MLGGADKSNGDLGTYITGADSVFAYRNHVTVEFGQGHRLEDRYQQLEGNGQYRRHIKLHSPAEVKSKHLADYIKQAYALATD
ncbi:DUF1801 domain-containing protein [Serratia ureilytica]|uniref:DUF1801 domain-containing protein n=1 Tax=Serratia ureilytica TaxID=300181 RepID=UPI0037132DF6